MPDIELETELRYQNHILQDVSRTFALTIPQLPPGLRDVVGNAYLLCRIADTIEDDTALSSREKDEFAQDFANVVAGQTAPQEFAAGLLPLLGESTSAAERDLIAHTPDVIRLSHSFNATQQQALLRCIQIMSSGMALFQRQAGPQGLANVPALDAYCYCVAGVVGEMLTTLFCEHSPEFARHGRRRLQKLAISFGQGLQMTNILKDIWDDQQRQVCWLPRDVFERSGFDLSRLQAGHYDPAFGEGLMQLIGIAQKHLSHALDYVLLMPRYETGMRRFCLWAIGMALLTLRKIAARPEFSGGQQVKISRRSVKATVLVSNIALTHDKLLNWLFNQLSRKLPSAPPDSVWQEADFSLLLDFQKGPWKSSG